MRRAADEKVRIIKNMTKDIQLLGNKHIQKRDFYNSVATTKEGKCFFVFFV